MTENTTKKDDKDKRGWRHFRFEDGSTDYLKEEDIDNVEIILVPEDKPSNVSGRVRKAVDYRKLADM